METDKLVQRVIRENFKECTIIMIAHRMETVIDADLAVVILGGEVVECGEPFKLLSTTEEGTKINADTEFARIVGLSKL